MPHRQMLIGSHTGPVLAVITTGTVAVFAQVVPTGDVEKWGSQVLLLGAITYLVRELAEEKKHSRAQAQKHQEKIEQLVDRSVSAQHENKLATQANTAALSKMTDRLDQVIGKTGD